MPELACRAGTCVDSHDVSTFHSLWESCQVRETNHTPTQNGFRIYVDIMTGKSCRQFRLIGPLSFIGQFVYPVGEEVIGYRKKTICSFKWSRTCANSSCGSLSNVWSILNMSRVSSENLACSEMLPTMITSCRVKVIMGERSSGGVINGLSR